jgi:hypothetical protein
MFRRAFDSLRSFGKLRMTRGTQRVVKDPKLLGPHVMFVTVTEYVVAIATPEKLDTKTWSPGGVDGIPGGGGPGEGDAYGVP